MAVAASILDAMKDAGCTVEQIIAVVRASENDDAEKKAKKREQNRIRQQNHRSRNALSRVTCVSNGDTLSPKKEIPPTPPKEKTTPIPGPDGPLSETSSDAKPKKRKSYSQEFEAVWSAYPTDPNMSKAEAFDMWKRLDAADKDALAASIPAFVAYCRANPDYRPIHMCRYIAKRRFDGHGQQQPAPAADDDTWQKRLEFGRRQQTWSSAEWGPRPGSDGCRVPKHLLQPTDGRDWREWERHAA